MFSFLDLLELPNVDAVSIGTVTAHQLLRTAFLAHPAVKCSSSGHRRERAKILFISRTEGREAAMQWNRLPPLLAYFCSRTWNRSEMQKIFCVRWNVKRASVKISILYRYIYDMSEGGSVAEPGCFLSRILDLDFFPSRDRGSNKKKRDQKNSCFTFFVALNFTKWKSFY